MKGTYGGWKIRERINSQTAFKPLMTVFSQIYKDNYIDMSLPPPPPKKKYLEKGIIGGWVINMPSQDCIFYLICNCFKSNWVCLPPFFLFASLFWFLNQGGGRPPPPRNVDEIRISYIAKSPYEISQNKTKFGRNYSYGTSSEWQLYHPEKICSRNIYTKLFRFRKKK